MQHQQKENNRLVEQILQEKRGVPEFIDSRVRISKDFTFYGVTQTKSGHAEISIALKMKMKDGSQLIIQYHELLSPMRYNGADKIELTTTGLTIVITGKNLEPIIDYLAEHRLVWIKEADSDFMQVEEGEVEIEEIEVRGMN